MLLYTICKSRKFVIPFSINLQAFYRQCRLATLLSVYSVVNGEYPQPRSQGLSTYRLQILARPNPSPQGVVSIETLEVGVA